MTRILIIGSSRSASFQIILLQPFRRLKEEGYCDFTVLPHRKVTEAIMESSDIVLFLRSVEPESLQCLEWARRLGKPTVYVIDDHFLAIPPSSRIGMLYTRPEYRETYLRFLRGAHLVKTESPVMRELIRERYNPNAVYFPGCVEFPPAVQKKKERKPDGPLVIGYEGSDKAGSFKPVTPALRRILQEYGERVRLEFFGYCPNEWTRHPQVTHIGRTDDYGKFMKRLQEANWDIGLAPLEDDLFFSCKSDVKYRDYAACRIPGVYSLSPVYRDSVAHKINGYFVPNTETGWYAGIKELIESAQLRDKIARHAESEARKQCGIEKCLKNWKNLLYSLYCPAD